MQASANRQGSEEFPTPEEEASDSNNSPKVPASAEALVPNKILEAHCSEAVVRVPASEVQHLRALETHLKDLEDKPPLLEEQAQALEANKTIHLSRVSEVTITLVVEAFSATNKSPLAEDFLVSRQLKVLQVCLSASSSNQFSLKDLEVSKALLLVSSHKHPHPCLEEINQLCLNLCKQEPLDRVGFIRSMRCLNSIVRTIHFRATM